ncbi:hypothetical protein HYH02_003228 [Chlamydomonas schloesseri]|uniref:Nas2 N-terminal domain-containing protein n=1 Tax=Chlamydomonas schloesseri TaxID=2026947 RepID=A0A836B9Z1_9CHLO|nr:hypothetical protein HYH02_003228 [Chlamydomonas schloesseri]|eukprot:KAG2452197.1 hypothetical protein HYH02_003228 [Chlamydomonas schloesseri]
MESEIADISERLNAPGMPGLKGSLLDKQGFPRSDVDVAAVRRDRHRLICLTNDHRVLSDRLAGLLGELHTAMREQAAAAAATPSPAAAAAPQPAAPGVAPGSTSTSAPMEVDGASAGASITTATTNSSNTSNNGATVAAAVASAHAGSSAAHHAPAAPLAQPSGPALMPFALVDEVSEGSPAAAAGLQVGDLLCAFGEVSGAAPAAEDGAATSSSSSLSEAATASTASAPASVPSALLLQRVAGVLGASEGRAVAATVLRQGAPLAVSLTPQRWSGRGLLGCHLKPL